MKYLMKHTAIVVTLLLTGISAAWAKCPEGKSEVLLITPSGEETVQCVNDNALPGITNKTLNIDVEVSCPCWDEETLENLPNLGWQPSESYPGCSDDYRVTDFVGYDDISNYDNRIIVFDYADFYERERSCIIANGDINNSSWFGAAVRMDNISHTEAYECARILRASKWWASCSEINH